MAIPNSKIWKYIPYPFEKLNVQPKNIEATFRFDFTPDEKEVYFAFSYPYTYTNLLNVLDNYDKMLKFDKEVYFHRELLTYSLEKRRLYKI